MEAEEWYQHVKEEEGREVSEEEIDDDAVEGFVAPLAAPGLFSIDASQGRSMPYRIVSKVMTCPCCGEEIPNALVARSIQDFRAYIA